MLLVVASTNGSVGIGQAMCTLQGGGSAVDAVEIGIRTVEDNASDHGVGFGGYPNLLGEVELDAAIIDGRTLEAGAVGAMRGFRHPISVARRVMEQLPHVFLVGPGAERFAGEMGFESCDLLTAEAHQSYLQLMSDLSTEDLGPMAQRRDLWRWTSFTEEHERSRGTVDFIAQDAAGDICAGVSTSGLRGKYPGRVGDSPIIGAGLYADNRYGAAACVGMGEMAIRACTAHSAVVYLRMGLSLSDAGQKAMEDLDHLDLPYPMGLIVMDPNGGHAGFSNAENRTYIYMTGDMDEPAVMPRTLIEM
jgi:beta-aspartyl-peptidase (threonine type)